MKAKEFREMSQQELLLTLKETEAHLFQLRFQAETEKLEAPSEITKAKRDIARIKTVLHERERAGAEQAAETEPAETAEGQHA